MKRWTTCLMMLAPGLLAVTTSGASEDLAVQYGCAACHQVEFPSVGPAYVDVANKYRDADDETITEIVERVKNGSRDVWGPIEMPPLPLLSDQDARTLVDWILNLPGEPT